MAKYEVKAMRKERPMTMLAMTAGLRCRRDSPVDDALAEAAELAADIGAEVGVVVDVEEVDDVCVLVDSGGDVVDALLREVVVGVEEGVGRLVDVAKPSRWVSTNGGE
jgi:hypothetical protein